MFGMISGIFSKSKSPAPNNESITIPPIRVSDYIGTASTLSEVKGVGNGPIITKDLLSLFNDKSTDKHQLFLDGVIGKNNGSFPVTNPVKDNVYFYAVERKYYKCNKSSSGVVNAPDVNFSEFSLSNFKGGVSGINITGAATGSGKLDEATGIMTVNTTVNWANITGKPSTLPNPNGLVIKLNGTTQTTYTGSTPVELNITAASIGAQAAGNYASASHNHDSVYSKIDHNHDDLYFTETEINEKLAGYQPKGNYALASHDHKGVYQPVGDYALTTHNHDEVYQPKGSYALSDHNHDSAYAAKSHNHSGVYAPISHTHTAANITALTGYTKALSASAIAATDSLNVALGKLEKALDGKAPTGNYAVVGHNHNDVYNTKSEITTLLAGKLGATANAVSASKLATAKTISLSGAVSGSSTFDGSTNMNVSVSLNGFDAGKITSGTISVDRLPKTALSEFIPVANKAARLTLTKSEAQNGDTVKEADTKRMYLVIDDTKLDTEEGYQEYTTVVDWSVITGKPSKFPAESHVHTWDQINGRPSTLPNPNGLTISLNGTAQTVYTGASAVAFNITPASIGAQVAGSYASASHNHDGVYAKSTHSHTIGQIGALTGYAKAEQAGAISATDTILSAFGKLEKALDGKQASGNYAPASHTHSEYQVKGDYALASHNHDTVYAKSSHSHAWDSITGKPGSFAPSAHNQASNTITAMTGYAKPSTTSAILVGDTLNDAIGKLEKALDGKQAAGSYALTSHNHSGVYAPVSHNHTASNITSLTGYKKGETGAAIGETDTLLIAIGKLEKSLDGKQVAGSYASSSHNHDGKYQPVGSYASASHNHDTLYAAKSHGHAWGEISGKPSTFAPAGHNQASNTITAMTGYTKAASVAAIAATDSLNVAIGKLEKALDGKQAAGSYAASNHNHSGVYAPVSHTHSYLPLSGGTVTGDITTRTGGGLKYLDGSGAAKWLIGNEGGNYIHIGYSTSGHNVPVYTYNEIYANGNQKVWHAGNLNPANYQPKGSYATTSHTHDDRYFTEAEINSKLGGYSPTSHNHSGVYAPVSHDHNYAGSGSAGGDATRALKIKDYAGTNNIEIGYSGSSLTASTCKFLAGYDTLANGTIHIKDITAAEARAFIGAQPAGSYAAASHTHPYLPTSGGTISGALTVTGQILSNADVVAYSDARMKTNVVKIESALDKVSKISGYTYDMQGIEFGGQRQAGVLAQELKEVLPEAVITDDNGYYAVRYTNIIPLLIEALKEEKSKRESLEDEVMSLKEENKTLQERLAKIERMLDIK